MATYQYRVEYSNDISGTKTLIGYSEQSLNELVLDVKDYATQRGGCKITIAKSRTPIDIEPSTDNRKGKTHAIQSSTEVQPASPSPGLGTVKDYLLSKTEIVYLLNKHFLPNVSGLDRLEELDDFPMDSAVGEEARRAIDAGCDLIWSSRQATGESPETVAIARMTVKMVLIYAFG